jgi:hypothetical protein
MAKILACVPIYGGGAHPAFKRAMAETMEMTKHEIVIASIGGDGMLDRARAFLFAQYVSGNFDYYWQLDADLQWHGSILDRLVAHDLDVVGAVYSFKVDEGHPKYQQPVLRPIMGKSVDEKTGLLEIGGLAGGFILAKDAVMKKMMADRPDELIHVNPDYGEQPGVSGLGPMPTYHFWQCIREQRPEWGENKWEYLSEDYALCKRMRESGFRVWADCKVRLRHWSGDKYHELDFGEKEDQAA